MVISCFLLQLNALMLVNNFYNNKRRKHENKKDSRTSLAEKI